MTKLNEIKLMNETMIGYLNKLGMSTKRNEIIKKMLDDDACFFKLDKSDAFIILHDVGVSNENMDTIYKKLISSDEYYYLKQAGKINGNEDELKVKYEDYNADKLFKKY